MGNITSAPGRGGGKRFRGDRSDRRPALWKDVQMPKKFRTRTSRKGRWGAVGEKNKTTTYEEYKETREYFLRRVREK